MKTSVTLLLETIGDIQFWSIVYKFGIPWDSDATEFKVSFDLLFEVENGNHQGKYRLARVEQMAPVLLQKDQVATMAGGRLLELEKKHGSKWSVSTLNPEELFEDPTNVPVDVRLILEKIEGPTTGHPFASLVPVTPNNYDFTTEVEHGPGSAGQHSYRIQFRDSQNHSKLFIGTGSMNFTSASDTEKLTGSLSVSGLQGRAEYFENWICWDPSPSNPCAF